MSRFINSLSMFTFLFWNKLGDLNIISFDLITTTVGWQVNKMGGDIRVVKKEGSGTLMRLCLLLSAPMDVTEQQCAVDLTDNGLVVSRITLLGQ